MSRRTAIQIRKKKKQINGNITASFQKRAKKKKIRKKKWHS
jgi:hypothetical protein